MPSPGEPVRAPRAPEKTAASAAATEAPRTGSASAAVAPRQDTAAAAVAPRRAPHRIEHAVGRRIRTADLPVRSWPDVLRSTVIQSGKDRITTAAASLAFHWFLAIFPGMVALLGVAGLVGLTPAQLAHVTHVLNTVLPAAAAKVITQSLRTPLTHGESTTAVIAGTLVALWGSVEAMASLQVGLDVAYDVGKDRGLVRRRLVALPLIAITVALGGVAFGLLVLGNPVGELLRHSVPVAADIFDVGWTALRWVVAIVLVGLLLSAYYRIGPDRPERRWEWISPGGVLGAVGWLAASAVYSYYLNDLGHASQTYGVFAGVVVLLVWLFVAGLAVLLGGELNRELERRLPTTAVHSPAGAGAVPGDRR